MYQIMKIFYVVSQINSTINIYVHTYLSSCRTNANRKITSSSQKVLDKQA